MTVAELIVALQRFDPLADVAYAWDGEARSEVLYVWAARQGNEVILSDGDVIYSDGSRPIEAPTVAEDRHWSARKDPGAGRKFICSLTKT